MLEQLIFSIHEMVVEIPFQTLVSPTVMKTEVKSMIGSTEWIIIDFLLPIRADTMYVSNSFFRQRSSKSFAGTTWQRKKISCMNRHCREII